MTATWHATALRRACLAVSVLEDIDLTPAEDGLVIDGSKQVFLPWWVIRDEIGEIDPESPAGHRRLHTLLALHRFVADCPDPFRRLTTAARVLALPADHVYTPGSGWVRKKILGGALVTGVGVTDVIGEGTVPLPWSVAEAARTPLSELWRVAEAHADTMGRLVVQRLEREPEPSQAQTCVSARQAVVRPVGGVDVLSLLACPSVRRYLADSDRTGMRAIAVPMRSRGWFDLARIDPAFVQAAWSATELEDRGLPRPLLVTHEEVAMAPAGDVTAVLAEPAAKVDRTTRSVRYQMPSLAPGLADEY